MQKWTLQVAVTASCWTEWHLPLKHKKVARRNALNKYLVTGEYPEFTGLTGVVDELDPSSTECLDFVKLLWPDSLCEHIDV